MKRFLTVKRNGVVAVCAAAAMTALAGSVASAAEVDKDIPEYKKTTGVAGNLDSVGSDTLNNLMGFWTEEFRKIYPNVNTQHEGKGSSTAPPALAEGAAQIGPMSRPMKLEEIEKIEAKFGYKPTAITVALDALAVYVHKDNPVSSLSLEQVDAIFSSTRKKGWKTDIATWGGAGATGGSWKSKPISIYGRNAASGTYGFFKKVALKKGDFKKVVKEQPGSAAVVNGVTEDLDQADTCRKAHSHRSAHMPRRLALWTNQSPERQR